MVGWVEEWAVAEAAAVVGTEAGGMEVAAMEAVGWEAAVEMGRRTQALWSRLWPPPCL